MRQTKISPLLANLHKQIMNSAGKSKDSWLYKNVDQSKEVQRLNSIEFQNPVYNVAGLSEFKTIGSYNWSTESKPHRPVIIVPGSPSILESRLSHYQQLKKIGHNQFVDENRYQQPTCPLEALFRSVRLCSPDFNLAKDVDIVTDRNNLRKLANFAIRKQTEPFRIDIQKVGNLVMLIRQEKKSRMYCNDFGKDFEKKYAKSSGREGSHRRVVSYSLGSIRLVVRFELDCAELIDTPRTEQSDINSLVSDLSQIKLDVPVRSASSASTAIKSFASSSKLLYVVSGQLDKSINQVELTTKQVASRSRNLGTKINQMMLSRTDSLVIGWHQDGLLKQIEKLTWQELCRKCNKNEQDIVKTLSSLSMLLGKLIEIAGKEPNVTLSIISAKENGEYVLKVFKSKEERQHLPTDLIEYLKNESQK